LLISRKDTREAFKLLEERLKNTSRGVLSFLAFPFRFSWQPDVDADFPSITNVLAPIVSDIGAYEESMAGLEALC
jgi:hypothetical protein